MALEPKNTDTVPSSKVHIWRDFILDFRE